MWFKRYELTTLAQCTSASRLNFKLMHRPARLVRFEHDGYRKVARGTVPVRNRVGDRRCGNTVAGSVLAASTGGGKHGCQRQAADQPPRPGVAAGATVILPIKQPVVAVLITV
jgi:hypothetical protein